MLALPGVDPHALGLAFLTYAAMTASPGPATLAIAATGMAAGRASAVALAAGVMAGSLFWGATAAAGLSVLLAQFGWALTALKILGGLYLLWLAIKAARSALTPARPQSAAPAAPLGRWFRRGLALHLTNPKSVFAWAAVMTLGLTPETGLAHIAALLAGCAALGVLIFGGYALLFSTAPAAGLYARARRLIEGALAALFAAAGLKLLTTRL